MTAATFGDPVRSIAAQTARVFIKMGAIPAFRAACDTGVAPVRKGVGRKRVATDPPEARNGDTVQTRAPGPMVIGSVKQVPARRRGVRPQGWAPYKCTVRRQDAPLSFL